jgi:hypothetical protein
MAQQSKGSNEEILATIKECAEKLGRSPQGMELEQMSKGWLTRSLVARRFGSHTGALRACGLERQDKCRPRSMMELFLIWATTVRQLKRLPSFNEMSHLSGISPHCYIRKFKQWSLVRNGMLRFIEKEKLEADWPDVLDIIQRSAPPRVFAKPTPSPLADVLADDAHGTEAGTTAGTGAETPTWGSVYGEPINHPCMANAPTNEDGVLGLFVAMARELGFIVTKIQKPFPDIEALRKIKGGRWRRVRIELEFESINFVTHEHDPKGCELIVCWIHNWKDSPVEVIELARLFKIG